MKTKEDHDPSEIKSRRRSSRPSDGPSSKSAKTEDVKHVSQTVKTPSPLKAKIAKVEALDRKVFTHEEQEAAKRDSASDLLLFRTTCTNIESVVSEINELKKQDTSSMSAEIAEKRIDAMILTTNLKKLNRLAQIRGKKAKESTQEVKHKVDGLHLELQNLLYEVMHMKKEIQKCMNFSSKDEEIDLIDVDSFYKEAPEEISKPDLTKDNPHQQMLARLDWELKHRKELSKRKAAILDRKRNVELEISQKSSYLSNLKPRLEQIIKATLPVQEFMGLPIEAERLLFEMAQYLPRPLYVLYIQAKAYMDVCDNGMTVDIDGDLLAAKTDFNSENVESEVSDDSDTEAADIGEREHLRARKHKKEKEKSKQAHRKRLVSSHPLSVHIKLSCKDKYVLSLKFYHLPFLHISTVKVDLTLHDNVKSTGGDSSSLLSGEVFCRDLLSPDSGQQSPNAANKYQLEKLGMTDLLSCLTSVGYPYFWVQWICGLNYLSDKSVASYVPDASLSVRHFQSVIKTLMSRLSARLALQDQLQQLEQLAIPMTKSSFPLKVVCLLTSWKRLSFEDFQQLPSTQRRSDLDDVVTEDCNIYLATLTREDTLNVAIVIHANYPTQPPLLLLSIKDEETSFNMDANLKSLECEVNAFTDEFLDDGNMMLSNMLRKLQICFDLFVETGSQHVTKEKLYSRKNRGRDRNRPYLYHKDGYFTHR